MKARLMYYINNQSVEDLCIATCVTVAGIVVGGGVFVALEALRIIQRMQ